MVYRKFLNYKSAKSILETILKIAKSEQCDLIYTWYNNEPLNLLRCGFIPINKKTEFMIKLRDDFPFQDLKSDFNLWNLNLIDTDAY